jgi:hypothetical protein
VASQQNACPELDASTRLYPFDFSLSCPASTISSGALTH